MEVRLVYALASSIIVLAGKLVVMLDESLVTSPASLRFRLREWSELDFQRPPGQCDCTS